MRNSKQLRTEAWNALSNNKWGISALVTVLIAILIAGIGAITCGIGELILLGPLAFGEITFFTKVFYDENPKIEDLFDGFQKSFLNSFLTLLLTQLFTALWSLLFVIPGIVKSYSYSMAMYIQHDNPELSSTECIDRSKEMMKGNKWRLFCLDLSFIGWWILSFLTAGILLLFVIPYVSTARVAFYEELKEK